MTATVTSASTATGWYHSDDCSLADFGRIVEVGTDLADYPWADEVVTGVLIYGDRITEAEESIRPEIQAELARALRHGPGVLVIRGAVAEAAVDRATDAFSTLIAQQKAAGLDSGDHFAKPGANDRVWGALDKLAVHDPEAFADYYGNVALALVSTAWLGPQYQVTSQVNVVNPGGRSQVAHRDYHLGFMSADQAARFPAHVHELTAALTLQGAVAHCDMPVETGPTMFLPHSQKYPAGYLAFHQPDFSAYFDDHYVQLPLRKGDAVFFSPALFHGAGTNHSPDVRRMANLLQISSAFGRAMETVDRVAAVRALYPVLQSRVAAGRDPAEIDRVIAASAEGYAFPTNLDLDQPIGGLAPPTQAELFGRALREGWDPERFGATITAQAARTRSQV